MSFIPQDPFSLRVARGEVSNHTAFEKFGRNPQIDTGTTPEDIWAGGGIYTGFPTGAAEEMEIVSSSANDTAAGTGARTVRVSGLIDSTGAAMPDVDVTLNGTTQVDVDPGQTYYRGATRVKVLTAGSGGQNAGTITVRHKVTTSNIFCVMTAGANQTSIAAFTVPLGFTAYVDRVHLSLARASGAAGSASTRLANRPFGGVFNTSISPELTEGANYNFSGGYIVYPERTDIKLSVLTVSDAATIVNGEFGGILIED